MTTATVTSGISSNRAPAAIRRWEAIDLMLVGALMVLAVVIRARGIGSTNLWLDEANSWLLTTYSLHDMVANIRHSPSSPLYFVLLKGWTAVFGDSIPAMRSLSLVASVPVVLLTYVAGRAAISRAGALIGAGLITLSPLQLYFAQEARVYMLATLVTLAAVVAYLRWRSAVTGDPRSGIERPDSATGRPVTAYAVLAAASLYTLPLAALVYFALGIDAVLIFRRGLRAPVADPASRRALVGPWLCAHLLLAFLCVPLLAAMDLSGAATSQAWRGPLGVAGALRNLLEFPLVTVHGLYFYPWDLYPAIVDHWNRTLVRRLVLVFPLLILALVAILSYPPTRVRRGPGRVLYLLVLVPLLAGTLVSIRSELSLTRYMLFVTPYVCLLVAGGVVRAPRWVGVPALAIIIVAAGSGLAQYDGVASRDSDYRAVAAVLERSASASDAVLIQPPEAGVQLAYYLRHQTISLWGLRAGASLDSALHGETGARTWIALDYRSRWYVTPPESLAAGLPGTVVSDRLEGTGEQRVRLLELRDARPTPLARGLSDTTAVCCGPTRVLDRRTRNDSTIRPTDRSSARR